MVLSLLISPSLPTSMRRGRESINYQESIELISDSKEGKGRGRLRRLGKGRLKTGAGRLISLFTLSVSHALSRLLTKDSDLPYRLDGSPPLHPIKMLRILQ